MKRVRYEALIALFIAVAAAVFQWGTIREGHNWGGDFAHYILHARNIVEGQSYSDTGYLYNPNNPFLAPPTYPPLFPLLLAGVYAVFGLHLSAMKALCILFFALALFTTFAMLRGRLPFRTRLAVVVVLGFNPFFWQFKDNILSDSPFLFLCTLSLWLMQRTARDDLNSSRSGWPVCGVLCGVAMLLSYATRSLGLVLPVCLIVHRIHRYGWLNRGAAVAVLTMAAGAVVENLTLHRDGRYFDQLAVCLGGGEVVLDLLMNKATLWWGGLVSMWDNGLWAPLSSAVAAGAVMISCVGFVAVIRRDGWSVLEWFALAYLASVLLWPMGHDPRFLIPILPLHVAYAAVGIHSLGAMATRARFRIAIGALVILIVTGGYVARFATLDYGAICGGITSRNAVGLFEFVRQGTETTDVIVFIKPRVLALMTGRRSAAYHYGAGDEHLWQYIEQIRATHLISARWSAIDRHWLDAFVDRHQERFDLVYRDDDHRVHRVRRSDGATMGGRQ